VAAIERLEATLGTMNGLERFRGHFYNWYDTRDLRPLDPKYVSSVDSGNLAGHLVALGQVCQDIIDRPLLARRCSPGLPMPFSSFRIGTRDRRRPAHANGHPETPG
jgi:hypothetical protein